MSRRDYATKDYSSQTVHTQRLIARWCVVGTVLVLVWTSVTVAAVWY